MSPAELARRRRKAATDILKALDSVREIRDRAERAALRREWDALVTELSAARRALARVSIALQQIQDNGRRDLERSVHR